MEVVDGTTLKEIIGETGERRRLNWQEVFRIGLDVGRALEYAFEQRIVHRNVTPGNLILRKQDQVVKLCDLMLAKALEGTQARQVTTPGRLVGNVAYMPPERTMHAADLDWRSDQYGLGATLFALLTGKPPHEGETLTDLVAAVRTVVPSFPEEVESEVDPRFCAMVLKMLSKDPRDRYEFPHELLRRFNEIGLANNLDVDTGVAR
jgi:serine/threonine protein kinase